MSARPTVWRCPAHHLVLGLYGVMPVRVEASLSTLLDSYGSGLCLARCGMEAPYRYVSRTCNMTWPALAILSSYILLVVYMPPRGFPVFSLTAYYLLSYCHISQRDTYPSSIMARILLGFFLYAACRNTCAF